VNYTNERAEVLDRVSLEVGHEPTETSEFVNIVVAPYDRRAD
jgi:hypothetical protein